MAAKATKGVDLGLEKPDKLASVTGSPPGEIDGSMDQGIGDSVPEPFDGGGTQSGSHPAKTQSKLMRFFG